MLLGPLIVTSLILVAWTMSILHTLLVFENRRFIGGRMNAPLEKCPPGHVTLVVPCKGNDGDLADNLRAYLRQDHPDFDAIFVVEDSTDSAVSVVEAIRAEFRCVPTQLVVAGPARQVGQKIHNLLSALAKLTPRTEILAFGDADAHPGRHWLHWLIQRVNQPGAGAVTGYRWYQGDQFHFPALVVASLNNLILGWMGRGQHFLVWGGSWAIRRELFERIGTVEHWQSAISDDLVVSRCLRATGHKIEFVPQCLCTSEPPRTWRAALEFLRRQLTIVGRYQPWYWYFLLLTTLGHTIGFVLSAGLALHPSMAISTRIVATISALGLYGLSILRGALRYSLIRSVFPQAAIHPMTKWLDIAGMPVLSLLGIGLIVSSSWSRTIRWRGISYQLDARGNVLRLRRHPIHVIAEPLERTGSRESALSTELVASTSTPCGVTG